MAEWDRWDTQMAFPVYMLGKQDRYSQASRDVAITRRL